MTISRNELISLPGKLYAVGTPIGNLGDITYRAVETLKTVNFICAEDTRVTVKLLNRYEIKKPTISYHEHSPRSVTDKIIERLLAGESGAVVTDAGMPCISDPGEVLFKLCIENGVPLEVVPGPSAVSAAIALSGLPSARFSFEGFLSVTKKQRFKHLESAALNSNTLIFFEAPHKLLSTLTDMLSYFGDRKISICREMTKIHEEFTRTTLSGALEYYSDKAPKGEFVLVIEGCPQGAATPEFTVEEAVSMARGLIEGGTKATEACKEAAKLTGFKKSELYSLLNEGRGFY